MGWMDTKTTQSSDPNAVRIANSAMDWGAYAANQPFKQYQGPWTAAWRPELQKAGGMLQNSDNVGTAELNDAAMGAKQAMTYQPMMIGSQSTAAGMHGIERTAARDAQGRMGAEFMGQYFNPFLTQVGGGMVSDMDRARRIQQIADEDKAIAAGAYGGSRHGVLDAESTRGFFDVLGSNLTDLYARGFDTAAGLGMQDADRFTNVDITNADRSLRSDMGNADRLLTSDVANMDRRLRSDMGNADRRLTADQSNQQTHLGAGQLRLSGADLMRGIGDTRHDNYLDSSRALMDFGGLVQGYDQAAIDRNRERFNEWRDYPFKQSEHMLKAFGTVTPMFGRAGTETKKPSVLEQIGGFGGLFF